MKISVLSLSVPESPVQHHSPLDHPLMLFIWGLWAGGEIKELGTTLEGNPGLEGWRPGQSQCCVSKLQSQGNLHAEDLLPQGTSVSFF